MSSVDKTDWGTPIDVFEELNKRHGPFFFDLCASEKNHKLPDFYSKENDAFVHTWSDFRSRLWMNPPYGKTILKWVEKANYEANFGAKICALVPNATATKWFRNHCRHWPHYPYPKRIKFVGAKDVAPFENAVVLFGYHFHEVGECYHWGNFHE